MMLIFSPGKVEVKGGGTQKLSIRVTIWEGHTVKTGQPDMPRMLRMSVFTLPVAVAVSARVGILGNLAACMTKKGHTAMEEHDSQCSLWAMNSMITYFDLADLPVIRTEVVAPL